MKRILAALAFASAFFVVPAAHADNYTNWGIEHWECNSGVFSLRLGSGAPARITGIRGTLAVSPIQGADTASGNTRQTLVVFTIPANSGHPATTSTVTSWAPGNLHHPSTDHWASWNLKQMGATPTNQGFDYDFTRLNLVSNDGIVQLIIINAASAPGVGPITNNPLECPDTEIQFEIMWAPNS